MSYGPVFLKFQYKSQSRFTHYIWLLNFFSHFIFPDIVFFGGNLYLFSHEVFYILDSCHCFLMTRFRLNIFGKGTLWMMMCISYCNTWGGSYIRIVPLLVFLIRTWLKWSLPALHTVRNMFPFKINK